MKIINNMASNTEHQKFKAGHIYKIVIESNENKDLLESSVICSDEGKLIDLVYGFTLATISLNTDISLFKDAYIEDITQQARLIINNKTTILGDCYE